MEKLSKRDLRVIFYYEWLRGSNASTATTNINSTFRESSVHVSTVHKWFARFKSGNITFDDEPRTGRPSSTNNDELERVVKGNPEANVRDLAKILGWHFTTVADHLNQLGYRKIKSQWVPHRLTEANRMSRLSICQSLLLRPKRKEFLEDLVTGDETWVLYDNDKRRAVWLPPGEEPPIQPKKDPHPSKILLSIFWDSKGLLLMELLPQGRTIDASTYVDQLQKLAESIKEKRRRRATVHLLQDNARPHVAKITQKKLQELGWEIVPHPPYSPDLAPSDYHLFKDLKFYLSKKIFKDFDSLKLELTTFFNTKPPNYWAKGINDLPNRWSAVIRTDGDYIVN